MTYNPPLVVGPDGQVWSVDDLRLALPAYRYTQKLTEQLAEVNVVATSDVNFADRPLQAVRLEISKLVSLRLCGME